VLDSVVWKPTFIYHIGERFTYFDLAYRPNNVRVHRRQAYLTLHATDPAVGKLFKALIDVHF
jgi:hypothetical protein